MILHTEPHSSATHSRLVSLLAAGAAIALLGCSSGGDGTPAAGGAPNSGGSAGAGAGGASGSGATAAGGATAMAGSSGSGMGGGSGGSAGTGGAATAGTSGASGSGGASGSSSTAVLSEDFESTSGTTPDETKWSIFNSASTGATPNAVTVTTEQFHSGSHSLKVDVKNAGAMLTTKVGLPPAGGAIYYRAWAKFVNGAAATSSWEPHVTFIESGGLLDNGDVDQGDEVRLGGQAGVIAANLTQGDGLSPSPWSMPCALCTDPPASDTWVCIEGLFDLANQKAEAWVDGVQVVNAASPSDWHAASTWPTALERIGFGWEAYGSVANTVYYDDIAIGYERLHCD